MKNTNLVRRALDRAEAMQGGAWGRIPKLDAIVAVLRGEYRDRVSGIIGENETTIGLSLAKRVRV